MQRSQEAESTNERWRSQCLQLLQDGDWHGLYQTAMSWRNAGWAQTPEPWLMDICSAVTNRQPKTAVHCCDMALQCWLERPLDRAMIHFMRGVLIADLVGDPLRALDDLDRATRGPAWLQETARAELARVQVAAERSRIRTPRVHPAPDYDAEYVELISSPSPRRPAPTVPQSPDGEQPALWATALAYVRDH